jgi:hypothetical protein
MATQPDSLPTRKLTTVVVTAPIVYTVLEYAFGPEIRAQVPPEVAEFLAGAVSTLIAGAVAYFVPDRSNVEG